MARKKIKSKKKSFKSFGFSFGSKKLARKHSKVTRKFRRAGVW